MLSKLKRPDIYLGHGVWYVPPGSVHPVKLKIKSVKINYIAGTPRYRPGPNDRPQAMSVDRPTDWEPESVTIERYGVVPINEVFMTKAEACAYGIRRRYRREIMELILRRDRYTRDLLDKEYTVKQLQGWIATCTRELDELEAKCKESL